MALEFFNGYAPEVFESTSPYDRIRKMVSADEGDYKSVISEEYKTPQVIIPGYKGFFKIDGGLKALTGKIEIWECVVARENDYVPLGVIDLRAFPAGQVANAK